MGEHRRPSSAEIEAAESTRSAHSYATAWLHSVLIDGNWAAAWPMCGEELRRDLLRRWLATAARPEDPGELLADEPTHRSWEPFCVAQVELFRRGLGKVPVLEWGLSPMQRPVALGCEDVRLLADGEPISELRLRLEQSAGVHLWVLLGLVFDHAGRRWAGGKEI